jgi:hypothetical protein
MMCRDVVDLTTDHAEGALSPWKRLSFRLHLAICPYCRVHTKQVETTIATLQALPKETPSDEARERALAAFRNRNKPL